MKQRIITGAAYITLLVGLLALKWFVPGGWGSLGFDALFTAVSVLGSLELLNALKEVSFPQKVITVAFCAIAVPLYVAAQTAMRLGFLAVGICGLLFATVLAGINVFDHGQSTIRGTMTCFMTILYCGVLSVMLSSVNHLAENSTAAIILLFLVVILTDTFAFLVGSVFKKWLPYKLAPKLSPNKTIIGAVGGVIGGMVGALIAYYVYYGMSLVPKFGTPLVYSGTMPAVVSFMLIGLVTSIFAQVGDLFESAIKRECQIKDMGKILPGHGGVLDRFDSMLFGCVIVLFSCGMLII